MQEYNHLETEEKWRKYWETEKIYQVKEDLGKPKFYVLDMFPYPSGAGLHVGHPLGYIASDIYARYKRLKGFNVLHPMGFDAFGLPAEQYALQTGIHPAVSTATNMQRYREQLKKLGFSFDWSREVATCDPKYYKWTQWIFTLLFDHYYDEKEQKAKPITELIQYFEQNGSKGLQAATSYKGSFSAQDWQKFTRKEKREVLMDYRLAYRKVGYVNWCEALGTVLANDQIKDGVSERGGYPVEKKAMTQWYLRITAYAERLLKDLDSIDWSEALKTMQSNWIGRSEGASVFFQVKDHDDQLEIYTTRPDTIFGATFMVLAPEHPLVEKITTDGQRRDIEQYIDYVKSRSEVDRQAEVKTVTGANTGAFAFNPFTEENIPIWIAEYVLMDYGTGAIMAVPSDDERDQRFAEKFGIDIIDVVDKTDYPGATLHDKIGKIINSGFITGMEVPEAIEVMIQKIEDLGIGKRQINYKMRDANFSRQRYWGEPFPITYDTEDIAHTLSLDELPLELPPSDDFKPTREGDSPLARLHDWVDLPNGFKRETDTMPAVAGSSWYFLRYMDPHNDEAFASKDALNYWQDVDLYIGGAEHAVSHLMYARFWHKFLHDKGLVPTNEPFKKLINQGMIQGVIESIFLQKEKVNGYHRFVCASLASEEDHMDFARIPVPIEYVSEYGMDNSYLDK
ncbi:MAG: leucine--tRNA ligase, partial [Saprospiraceae bacterium]|nr:leucine--tRNA ligase [Saprospiraceae bacterium]